MYIKNIVVKKLNNQEIQKITFINDNNYSISFFNFGGYVDSILIPYKNNSNKTEDVLLGYKNINEYINDTSFFNCIIGRVSNRVSNSNFTLNNKNYVLSSNIKPHHLHGGLKGFNKKIWKIEEVDKTKDKLYCILKYTSVHLEEGYPGNLDCTVVYSLTNKNEIIIDFYAESDQDTLVNLTNHNYWNFHGHNKNYQNIYNHHVKINANHYCETDDQRITTGKLLNVKKTKFNFLFGKTIDKKTIGKVGIDTCYSINNFNNNIKEVGSIFSNLTKMGVIFYSNQPGLQFYTGNMMNEYYKGKYLKKYGTQFGICFEPQLFPDAIKHNNFITPILRKGEKYNSKIIMELKNSF